MGYNCGDKMKALILAAGSGTRLAPITDEVPKAMVAVNGVPIIEKQIINLANNGVRDIYVVVGYKQGVLTAFLSEKYPFVSVIENSDYLSTNNMYSAYLARGLFSGGEFIMMNADVFFDESVITELMKPNYRNAIVVDIGSYNDESMKVIQSGNRITAISKQISREEALGNSIDVYKFSAEAGDAFFARCREYVEVGKELKKWSEVALNDILSEYFFEVCPLSGRWFEIDDHDDLAQANRLFTR